MKKLQRFAAILCLGFLGVLLPPFYCSYAESVEWTTPLPTDVVYSPQAVMDFIRRINKTFNRYDAPSYMIGVEQMECNDYCDDVGISTVGWSLKNINPSVVDLIVGEAIVIGTAYGFSVHFQENKLFFHYAGELSP